MLRITVNPERLASIIFSVFLTGPLLTSIKFNVLENVNTKQYRPIHIHAEQTMNRAHVNKAFACTHCLLTVLA